MKKKLTRRSRTHHHVLHTPRAASHNYLIVVRSWMFLVAFAMMLGLGAMMGNFISQQLNQSTPQVAGASIEVQK